MALFYFISVSVQLYQVKIGFIPTLYFNQVILELDDENTLSMNNIDINHSGH